jgi:hypothetical protein
LVSVDVRDDEKQAITSARVDILLQAWATYRTQRSADSPEKPLCVCDGPATSSKKGSLGYEDAPIYVALPVLATRMARNVTRQPDVFYTRIAQAPVLCLCFFLFFLRLSHGPTGAQDRIGLIAECTASFPFLGFMNLAAIYPQERRAFMHEHASAGRRYSSAAFVGAFSLSALGPELVSAILSTIILNVATGMRVNARIFFEFAVAAWAQLNFGESIGIVFATYWSTMGLAVSLVSVFLTVAGQSSGVFSASIPTWLNVRTHFSVQLNRV